MKEKKIPNKSIYFPNSFSMLPLYLTKFKTTNVSQIWKKMLTKRIDFTRTHFNADSLFVIYLL